MKIKYISITVSHPIIKNWEYAFLLSKGFNNEVDTEHLQEQFNQWLANDLDGQLFYIDKLRPLCFTADDNRYSFQAREKFLQKNFKNFDEYAENTYSLHVNKNQSENTKGLVRDIVTTINTILDDLSLLTPLFDNSSTTDEIEKGQTSAKALSGLSLFNAGKKTSLNEIQNDKDVGQNNSMKATL